jgi:hypothetical protein
MPLMTMTVSRALWQAWCSWLTFRTDEDEDMEDDNDDEGSQGTAVPLEDQFTDLTNAPMTVQSVVSPIAFLTMVSLSWVAHDGNYRVGDSLAKVRSSLTQTGRHANDLLGHLRR